MWRHFTRLHMWHNRLISHFQHHVQKYVKTLISATLNILAACINIHRLFPYFASLSSKGCNRPSNYHNLPVSKYSNSWMVKTKAALLLMFFKMRSRDHFYNFVSAFSKHGHQKNFYMLLISVEIINMPFCLSDLCFKLLSALSVVNLFIEKLKCVGRRERRP